MQIQYVVKLHQIYIIST